MSSKRSLACCRRRQLLAGSITRASLALTGVSPFLRSKVLFFIVKTLIHPLFCFLHKISYATLNSLITLLFSTNKNPESYLSSKRRIKVITFTERRTKDPLTPYLLCSHHF